MAQSRFVFLPITLAGWQLRQTWRLLLVIGAGVVAAVIIICAVPLYSQISETAELQSALSANSAANASLLIQASEQKVFLPYIQQAQDKITGDFDEKLGSFLQPGAQFSSELDDQTIFLPSLQRINGKEQTVYKETSNLFNLIGETTSQARPHINLI